MLLQFLDLPKMWNQPSIFSLTVVGRRYYLSLYETDKKKSDNKYDEHKTNSRRQNRKKQVCVGVGGWVDVRAWVGMCACAWVCVWEEGSVTWGIKKALFDYE